MMAKEICWYEAIDVTSRGLKEPKQNLWLDDFCSTECELIGKYSSEENGIKRLKKWAEDKGIHFDEHFSVRRNHFYWDEGADVSNLVMIVGLFYDLHDNEVTIDDDYDYATFAVLIKKTMKLDEDI